MTTYYDTLMGRNPADKETEHTFTIQLRKGKKAYRTVLTTRKFGQALAKYRGYNIGNGCAKRMLVDGTVFRRDA